MKVLSASYPDFGNLILRLGTGLTMIVHGWLKFSGGEPFLTAVGTNWSAAIGIHFAPHFWGIFVAAAQTLGGALIALGIFCRPAALLLTFVMAVGAVMVFERAGMSFKDWSHPFEAALTCIAIALMGTGRFGLDKFLSRSRA